MSRYIDADALLSKGQFVVRRNDYGEYFVTVEEINKMPTVDAVQVVRCRECKYFVKNTWECVRLADRFGDEYSDARVYPEYYCADGERRSDEQQTKG
jgi:DMSO/TMAO reductase YedYZ molybdopterin-dependent catalytic subunit